MCMCVCMFVCMCVCLCEHLCVQGGYVGVCAIWVTAGIQCLLCVVCCCVL